MAPCRYSQQEIGVAPSGGRREFLFEFLAADPELGGVGSVEVHLGFHGFLEQRGETVHRLQVRTAGGGQSQKTRVLDEEHIILSQPELESLQTQRSIANASYRSEEHTSELQSLRHLVC